MRYLEDTGTGLLDHLPGMPVPTAEPDPESDQELIETLTPPIS
jgi:hypothetical protein